MDGFGSTAASSAGQRTSVSPDYAPSESPRPSLFVNHQVSPRSFQFFPQSVENEAEEENEDAEEESLDDSSEDDFDGSSTEEVYDNNDKKFFYESNEARGSVHPKEDSEVDDDEVVYKSTEHDEVNENQTIGQTIDDDGSKPEHSDARGASATPTESLETLVNSPTSKLLASCLDTDQSFLHDYLSQRKELVVQFLQCHNDVVESFLTRHPDFVLQGLRRNQQQAWTLFVENPTWYVAQYLNKYPYFLYNHLIEHPEDVETFINANPKYFDQYLIRHPEFAVNYLHFNRLPSGFGIPPDMFGVTSIVMSPPTRVQTSSPTSAGLPSPDPSPQSPLAPPPPRPRPNTNAPVRKSTTRRSQATRKSPTKVAGRSQQSLPKTVPEEAKPKIEQQPPKPALAPAPAPILLDEAPIAPRSGPQRTARPSGSKNTIATTISSSSNGSSQAQTYRVLLTSSYGQTAGEFMDYPAAADLLAASRKQDAGTKGSWRLFEEDRAIKHMLDVRDEARLAGESRFEEVSTRLKAEGIERGFFAIKNYWNRTGRARSGFDERKNKTAPLATSKQGKAFRQKKAKGDSKNKNMKGKGIRAESEGEEDEDDSECSVQSEEEDTPPPRRHPPPPPQGPAPAPAPAPAPQQLATKRPADHDDEALAWAMSRGTRPKKQRTG
jgi:hypothetical protein